MVFFIETVSSDEICLSCCYNQISHQIILCNALVLLSSQLTLHQSQSDRLKVNTNTGAGIALNSRITYGILWNSMLQTESVFWNHLKDDLSPSVAIEDFSPEEVREDFFQWMWDISQDAPPHSLDMRSWQGVTQIFHEVDVDDNFV